MTSVLVSSTISILCNAPAKRVEQVEDVGGMASASYRVKSTWMLLGLAVEGLGEH